MCEFYTEQLIDRDQYPSNLIKYYLSQFSNRSRIMSCCGGCGGQAHEPKKEQTEEEKSSSQAEQKEQD